MTKRDKQMLEKTIQEVLSDLGHKDCNTPNLSEDNDQIQMGGITTIVTRWDVYFTCKNSSDRNNRNKVSFSIQSPLEKSEKDLKAEITSSIKRCLIQQ